MHWVRLASLMVVVAIGCGESVRREEPLVECMSDLDCAEGKKCVTRGPGASGAAAPRDPGRDLATGGTGMCPVTSCGTGCPAGQVCRAGAVPSCPMYTSCQTPCTEPDALPCDPGAMCRPSGMCEPVRCDDSDYPGCPAGMACDPTIDLGTRVPGGYSIFGTDQYPFTDSDHGSMLTAEQRAAAAALCVFLKCDEPGGFACADGFRCDVANALPTSSGCVGVPCRELGRCSTDAFICEPTSTGRRTGFVDPHGCVEKNCEEGRPCPEKYLCDLTKAPTVDGCAPIRCDEPGGTCGSEAAGMTCAPDREGLLPPYAPDEFGCVNKRCDLDNFPCPAPMVCDPANSPNLGGCVNPSGPGLGGTGGTGGTSGSAGTGGTSGAGGATADTGVCR